MNLDLAMAGLTVEPLCPLDQVGVNVQGDQPALGAEQVDQDGGRVAGAGADLKHTLARGRVESLQHGLNNLRGGGLRDPGAVGVTCPGVVVDGGDRREDRAHGPRLQSLGEIVNKGW